MPESKSQTSRPRKATEGPSEQQAILARAEIVGEVPDFAGIYSNFASVGLTSGEAVIDFAVLASSADRTLMEQWIPKGIYPATPIARVRLPYDVAEGLVTALTAQLAKRGEVFRTVPATDAQR